MASKPQDFLDKLEATKGPVYVGLLELLDTAEYAGNIMLNAGISEEVVVAVMGHLHAHGWRKIADEVDVDLAALRADVEEFQRLDREERSLKIPSDVTLN